jgi:hypothetical protein
MRHLILALSVAALAVSCVALPVAESTRGTSRIQDEAATVTVRSGVTTREEVLLVLGEPDAVTEDAVFVYTGRTWWRWRGIVVIPSPYIVPGMPLPVPFAGEERDVATSSLRSSSTNAAS